MLDQSYYRKTDEIIEHYGKKAGSLIPIMQDIQAEYRYLPGELLTYVAEQIGITEAKAYSVATFYENFSFEAKGKYVIKVCDGTACHVRKSMPVLEALWKELGLSRKKHTTDDSDEALTAWKGTLEKVFPTVAVKDTTKIETPIYKADAIRSLPMSFWAAM